MPDDAARITADDLVRLNRAELRRVGGLARRAATALFVVAALGVLAWGWDTVHSQIRAASGFGPGAPSISLADRIDLVSNDLLGLLLTGTVAGAAVLVRLFADALVDRSGGTLCGYQVGDPVDPLDDLDDDFDDDDGFTPLTPNVPR